METIEEEVVVSNPHGLHARPAALFVQIANKFDSSVQLVKEGEIVDGKSIIGLLSLGVNSGMRVLLKTEGIDALQAFNELRKFLENNND